jgi:hypothetical protein
LSSSFVLSKIKILASTAIPILRIKPAMPARVSVTGMVLKIAKVKRVYKIKRNQATCLPIKYNSFWKVQKEKSGLVRTKGY